MSAEPVSNFALKVAPILCSEHIYEMQRGCSHRTLQLHMPALEGAETSAVTMNQLITAVAAPAERAPLYQQHGVVATRVNVQLTGLYTCPLQL